MDIISGCGPVTGPTWISFLAVGQLQGQHGYLILSDIKYCSTIFGSTGKGILPSSYVCD